MQNKRSSIYFIGALLLLAVLYVMFTYNRLVKKEEDVKNKWSEVQNAYQRRLDLIPNLVNTVKGGADFEQTTLQKVVEARAKAGSVSVSGLDANTYNNQLQAQDNLAAATNQLLIKVENYPDIKGTKAFNDLQVQLEGTERRIKVARKDFNESVRGYNNAVKTFPTKLVAAVFSFLPKEGFQSDAGAEKAVEIKF